MLPMLSPLPHWVQAGASGVVADALSLWCYKPARPWAGGAALGNASPDAMVFGRPAQGRLQFDVTGAARVGVIPSQIRAAIILTS